MNTASVNHSSYWTTLRKPELSTEKTADLTPFRAWLVIHGWTGHGRNINNRLVIYTHDSNLDKHHPKNMVYVYDAGQISLFSKDTALIDKMRAQIDTIPRELNEGTEQCQP